MGGSSFYPVREGVRWRLATTALKLLSFRGRRFFRGKREREREREAKTWEDSSLPFSSPDGKKRGGGESRGSLPKSDRGNSMSRLQTSN